MANMLNTITVDGIIYDAADYAKEKASKEVKETDNLGKDAFLKLLVAQMKYQDPLDPQDNSSFVAELAQFSALEQMTNVAENLDKLSTVVNGMDTSVMVGQMSHMIGMNVDWTIETGEFDDDGNPTQTPMTGIISGVNLSGDEPSVSAKIGNSVYKLSLGEIDRIYDNSEAQAPTTGTVDTGINVTGSSRSALLGQLGNLIGMDIEWDQPVPLTYDENGDQVYLPLKGVVRGVNLEGNEPAIIAQVGTDTYRVDVKNIANVYFGMVEPEEEVVEE